jgi:P4 family phage/plasmid primase-like protien
MSDPVLVDEKVRQHFLKLVKAMPKPSEEVAAEAAAETALTPPEDELETWLKSLPARCPEHENDIWTAEVLTRVSEVHVANPGRFVQLVKELKGAGVSITDWRRAVEQARKQAVMDRAVSRHGILLNTGSDAEVTYTLDAYLTQIHGAALVHTLGELYHYDGAAGVWRPFTWGAIQKLVMGYDGVPVANGSGMMTPLKVSKNMCGGVEALLRVLHDVPEFFEGARPGVAFANTFVEVKNDGTIITEPHSPEHRATLSLPFAYQPDAVPRMLLNTMLGWFRGDEDIGQKIVFLQQFIGACLIGKAPRFERALICSGDGSNGKSTLFRVVEALFGGRGHVVSVTPQDMANEYRLALLAQARVNIVYETPGDEIRDTDDVKAVLSGDQVTARNIYQKPFDFHPPCGHMFSTNTLPVVRDYSDGWWRRFTVLIFGRNFDENDGADKIIGLADNIVQSELDAVASWAIQGAASLMRDGKYVEVPSSIDALQTWRGQSDHIAEFIATCLVPIERDNTLPNGGGVPASQVSGLYAAWAKVAGYKPVSGGAFWQRLGLAKHLKHATLGHAKLSYWFVRGKKSGEEGFFAGLPSLSPRPTPMIPRRDPKA